MNGYESQNAERRQSTNEHIGWDGIQQICQKIEQNNYLLLMNVKELADKNERAMQQKRRVRTAEKLLVAKERFLSVEYFYDNGTTEVLQLALNVTGEFGIFNLDFHGSTTTRYFGIFFRQEATWVTGEKKKVRGGYLYEAFIRAGIKFNPQVPVSILKRLLFEYFAPLVDKPESTFRVPSLAGWLNEKFCHAGNFPFEYAADFPDLPILHKNLVPVELDDVCIKNYFNELYQIQRWQDRLCITLAPFYGLSSSLLADKNMDKYCLNFVMLEKFSVEKICSWMRIYNRENLAIFSLDVTSKEFWNILKDTQDEVLIFDASIDESSTNYEKNKQKRYIYKILDIISGKSPFGIEAKTAFVFVSKNVIPHQNCLNIIVDEDFYKEDDEYFSSEEIKFEAIFSNFVIFIQNNMEKVHAIVRQSQHEFWEDSSIFMTMYRIAEAFWKSLGVDLEDKIGLPFGRSLDSFREYYCRENLSELLPLFVEAVRRQIPQYFMQQKCYGAKYTEKTIYFDDLHYYFPTEIFDEIIRQSGLSDQRSNILMELQEAGKILRDSCSISKTPQIGNVRFEAYVITRDFFETIGKPDLIALSQEVVQP